MSLEAEINPNSQIEVKRLIYTPEQSSPINTIRKPQPMSINLNKTWDEDYERYGFVKPLLLIYSSNEKRHKEFFESKSRLYNIQHSVEREAIKDHLDFQKNLSFLYQDEQKWKSSINTKIN